MTLIVALKCTGENGEGVLITSDSKATTYGGLSLKVQKIFPIVIYDAGKEIDLAIAAGAGYASMVRRAIRIAEKEFGYLAEKEWKKQSPTFDQFEEAVHLIEEKIVSMLSDWKKKDVPISFSMILVGVSPDGKASIYIFDNTGLATPVHDSQGFASIGSGFVTGGSMILNMFWRPDLEASQAQMLTAYAIQNVSHIDPQVGPFDGASYYFRVMDNSKPIFGELKSEHLNKYLQRVQKREETIKKIWKLSDELGEDTTFKQVDKIKKRRISKKNKRIHKLRR